jgi:hypothetical protein
MDISDLAGPAARSEGAESAGPPPTLLAAAIGGRRGVLDSALPTGVFVVVDVLT